MPLKKILFFLTCLTFQLNAVRTIQHPQTIQTSLNQLKTFEIETSYQALKNALFQLLDSPDYISKHFSSVEINFLALAATRCVELILALPNHQELFFLQELSTRFNPHKPKIIEFFKAFWAQIRPILAENLKLDVTHETFIQHAIHGCITGSFSFPQTHDFLRNVNFSAPGINNNAIACLLFLHLMQKPTSFFRPIYPAPSQLKILLSWTQAVICTVIEKPDFQHSQTFNVLSDLLTYLLTQQQTSLEAAISSAPSQVVPQVSCWQSFKRRFFGCFSAGQTDEDERFTPLLGPPTALTSSDSTALRLIHTARQCLLPGKLIELQGLATVGSLPTCSICLNYLVVAAKHGPCSRKNHLFHIECINHWTTHQENSCPLCRGNQASAAEIIVAPDFLT